MALERQRSFRRLAVIGAGNMGSGIAQKMATEDLDVVLVDLDDEKVERGLAVLRRTLEEGVERKVFRPDEAKQILKRVHGTSDWSELSDVDLAVEAVFEDLQVKRDVFRRLDGTCRSDAILATNTSSFAVRELAAGVSNPERVVGLHYFYHPAKNRLVEVIPTALTSESVRRDAWTLQERMGKTPIHSADASGFVVNRFFVPWLNEAVRLVEEGIADIPTVEATCKKVFGVGMGPFELMNVTGIPIALHAATTLGEQFGPLYAPADSLRRQVESGAPWGLDGAADESRIEAVERRMLAVVFYVAARLVEEGVGSIEDTDIGARVGLRWPRGPFEKMNRRGVSVAAELVRTLTERWNVKVPANLATHADSGRPFTFRWVKSETRDGVATLTVNRPDAMNALNEAVVQQLGPALAAAAADPEVDGIVISGAGKAFVAGADIRFFVRNIDAGDLDRIVAFTEAGHALLNAIENCPKPVVARLHGLALGGGVELALACHAIVAAPRASLAFPETGIGIYPGLGGTQRTTRRVGAGLAKALIYTGRTLTAEQAAEIGLVDEVVPFADLDSRIRELIEGGLPRRPRPEPSGEWATLERFFSAHPVDLLREGRAATSGDESLARAMKQVGFKAPVALRLAERLIDGGRELDLAAGLQLELDHLREIFGTADAYEGLSSLGVRRPEFKGR